jgi:hypothetical protein
MLQRLVPGEVPRSGCRRRPPLVPPVAAMRPRVPPSVQRAHPLLRIVSRAAAVAARGVDQVSRGMLPRLRRRVELKRAVPSRCRCPSSELRRATRMSMAPYPPTHGGARASRTRSSAASRLTTPGAFSAPCSPASSGAASSSTTRLRRKRERAPPPMLGFACILGFAFESVPAFHLLSAPCRAPRLARPRRPPQPRPPPRRTPAGRAESPRRRPRRLGPGRRRAEGGAPHHPRCCPTRPPIT